MGLEEYTLMLVRELKDGDPALAKTYLTKGIEIFYERIKERIYWGDQLDVAQFGFNLGRILFIRNEYDTCEDILMKAQAIEHIPHDLKEDITSLILKCVGKKIELDPPYKAPDSTRNMGPSFGRYRDF